MTEKEASYHEVRSAVRTQAITDFRPPIVPILYFLKLTRESAAIRFQLRESGATAGRVSGGKESPPNTDWLAFVPWIQRF